MVEIERQQRDSRKHAGRFVCCLAACLVSLASTPLRVAQASSDPSLEERIRQLEDLTRRQGELLLQQQEYIKAQQRRIDDHDERLRHSEQAQPVDLPAGSLQPSGKAATAISEASATKSTADAVKVSAGYGGLSIKSSDGDFKFAVGGRIQLDGAVYDEDKTSLGNGTEIRRARLKGSGTMWKVWDYKLEVNFDNDGASSVTDAWLRYSVLKPLMVTVGHQKVPFSQQSMTSSNWQVFQERALLDAFIDSGETGRRRLGVAVSGYGDHWNVNTGVFGEGVDDAGTSNEDWGAAGRFLFMPVVEDNRVLTLGGSVYYRDFQGDAELRFRNRAESHIAGNYLVDTGSIAGEDSLLLYNGEASTVWGPFHAQAEFTGADVRRGGEFANASFTGWYAQTGYFLTGESRNFDHKSAKYKRIMPNGIFGDGGRGAWELAFRYSDLDLTDGGIQGGRQRDFTVGLNWWATPSIAFRLNYTRAYVYPNSGETLDGIDEQVDVIGGRGQVVF